MRNLLCVSTPFPLLLAAAVLQLWPHLPALPPLLLAAAVLQLRPLLRLPLLESLGHNSNFSRLPLLLPAAVLHLRLQPPIYLLLPGLNSRLACLLLLLLLLRLLRLLAH